ncbi:30S ribosome-binding factor RbfA [Limosilactobacillus equigenerosi]|uniref:Ribosome-binding factor A n=1 Tax=Limosilactobacillus equigenerosi DSM 18793 = JCM 14505 TaxID=1423742 RepID=A0A0R1UF80_9LACO|nr:30S ribosome-binding factor RbfA [Limosilactobacillus equigenerosi]KRL92073.1 Ribosome-binding factor A [Limosilactobacillus equigenerosi DSM 18793 = JCM 14505]MCQ2570521.1 30S ribosome-binding factor RbfA [Limosilactobacillus sp.]
MPSKQYRVERLAQQIQREVDDILLKRVRDPRVQDVTITGVDVTGDLQQATIYYSLLSEYASDGQKAQAGLEKATGLVRHELSSRLNIFKTPQLTFKRDPAIAYGNRIDQLLNQLKRDNQL